MSFFETLMNFISSLFGGNKTEQPAEQQKAEPQPLPAGVDEIVPQSDPRVAATNGNRGLVVRWEREGGQYRVYYESGKSIPINTPATPDTYISNGIDSSVIPQMNICISDVQGRKDTSRWTEQQIFDAKVYLGKIRISKE